MSAETPRIPRDSEAALLCVLLGYGKPRGKTGRWVFQQTTPAGANCSHLRDPRLQIRRYVIPRDPMTDKQLFQRRRMVTASIEWAHITPEHKAALVAAVGGSKIKAWRVFLSKYLRQG